VVTGPVATRITRVSAGSRLIPRLAAGLVFGGGPVSESVTRMIACGKTSLPHPAHDIHLRAHHVATVRTPTPRSART